MPRSRSQVWGSGTAGGLIGAFGGFALGSAFDGSGAVVGAVVGALVVGLGEALTDVNRTPGQPKPLVQRVISGAALAAGVAWLADLVLPDLHLAIYGLLVGAGLGGLGFRMSKVMLGALVGLGMGLILEGSTLDGDLAWLAATTLIAYRLVAAVIFRGREQVTIEGEQVPAAEMEFVVPFASLSRYVGVDYLREYADLTGADFVRNPTDVGIVASFDDLGGPEFDPAAVHPLIREFYEHTSRFHLSITPAWRWWMRPAYLIYRTTIAKPFGQANPPFDIRESQRGVVSWIDTIDLEHSGAIDFRAWVRAYQESNEPIYVGIYTVLRHEGAGYVSVGFPLPHGNFTATLLPFANGNGDLLLKSESSHPYTGHYLSAVEDETDSLTTLRLRNFAEEIDVYVEDGELFTDHRFFLNGVLFLTLRYTIERS